MRTFCSLGIAPGQAYLIPQACNKKKNTKWKKKTRTLRVKMRKRMRSLSGFTGKQIASENQRLKVSQQCCQKTPECMLLTVQWEEEWSDSVHTREA